ncbi:MAG TPA: HAMP domain-containing sensor histidine kinase [Tepidisphaeraceae bacterium]|jgi:signal transduction histidine kinase|nr:HAMP domain-containing sensor histidine kinase [Tepidisphaeraceae bacterium]
MTSRAAADEATLFSDRIPALIESMMGVMGRPRIPMTLAIVATALLVAGMSWLRLVLAWKYILPVGYGVPLIIIATFRRRSLLWAAVAAFLVVALYKYIVVLPKSTVAVPIFSANEFWLADVFVAADLLVIGTVAHLWIRNQDRAERHTAQLEEVNAELLTRETELAQTNGQLKSQSAKLERQGGELRGVIEELQMRRHEAEEASIRKTRFLAAVSHDIRTPANAIGLLAELVRRTATNPAKTSEVAELANELQASAISLVNLLSDVLDVARFDSGRVELQESEFPLVELLAELHRQMLPLAREKKLEFNWHAPAVPIVIRTDRIKLARVLGNLIGNAIKFTDAGSVRVEADEPDATGIAIRVIDSGVGIPVEFQRHIFDEFFQIKNPERNRNKGTGLGLTICKRLTDAMGGALEVHSGTGQGSTFTVKLPSEFVVQSVALAGHSA